LNKNKLVVTDPEQVILKPTCDSSKAAIVFVNPEKMIRVVKDLVLRLGLF